MEIKKIFPVAELSRVKIVKVLMWELPHACPESGQKSYGQTHKVQAMNEAIEQLEGIKEGDMVEVVFWINSKESIKFDTIDYFPCIRIKTIKKMCNVAV